MDIDVRDGILGDLERVRAMWMGDIRDLWCGGNKDRCTGAVQDLVRRGLVEVRRGRKDARRRYVVLTKKGADAAGLEEGQRSSRTTVAAGERVADQTALFMELVRNGVRRLEFASGVSEWVFLSRDNRTWSRQLDAWVAGRCEIPTWIPKPTWPTEQVLQALNDRGSAVWEAARAASRQGLGLVPVPGDRTRGSEEEQFWCHIEGRLCLLEDLRGFPVHRLCALAQTPDAAERHYRCAVVETVRDATRVAKYLGPAAPRFFLVSCGDKVRLFRLQGGKLIPVAGPGR